MFHIIFSKRPFRKCMFIDVVYNEDKIISFFLYIYLNLHISYEKVRTNNLSKQQICINVTHVNYSENIWEYI